MDLVIRNATLADGRRGIDIGIAGAHIAAVEAGLPTRGVREIDAGGDLVAPPFWTPISIWMRRSATACRALMLSLIHI